MAAFVAHEACQECGSRDNLARYDDGSAYCFGCSHYEPASGSSSHHRKRLFKVDDDDTIKCKPLPDDFNREFSQEALDWVYQYGITVEELLRFDCGYSKRNNQLINTFFDESGQLVLWSGRNFWPKAKSKYFVTGDKNGTNRILHIRNSDSLDSRPLRLVIVEDCMSAIKTARYSDSWPLLGSSMSNTVLASLRPSYGFLDIWLDGNKMDNAIDIARRAKFLGFSTRVVYTEKDPKEVDDKEVKIILDKQ